MMRIGPRRPRVISGFGAMAAVLTISACGSSSDKSTSSGSSGSGTSSAKSSAVADVPYSGPEKGFPNTLPEPKKKPGFTFTLGYQTPFAAIPSLAAAIKGAREETKRLGGKFILKDPNFDANRQATQLNELLSQKVDAIATYPLNPKALRPGIAQAVRAGIPVVTQDTPPQADAPLLPGVKFVATQSRDRGEYGLAKAAATAKPGASFVDLGIAAPVPLLQYGQSRGDFWAKKLGMKRLGRIDASTDTPDAASKAMSALLAKYPSMDYVFAYNDQAALAASAVARANGKPNIRVIGQNGEPVITKSIAAGQVWGTWNSDFKGIGVNQVRAAYDLMTKQKLPAERTVAAGVMVTKDNAGSVTPLSGK